MRSAILWVIGGLATVAGTVWALRRRARKRACPLPSETKFGRFDYHALGVTGDQPPVVFLHGAGGSDVAFMQKVTLPGFYVRGPIEVDGRHYWLEDNLEDTRWLDGESDDPPLFVDPSIFTEDLDFAVAHLTPFIEAIERCYGRPIVAGHSQGGAVALLLGLRRPDLVERVVVASSGLPRSQWMRFMIPTVLVHGGDDQIVPARTAVEMSERTGAQLHVVPGRHELSGSLLEAFVEEIVK